MMYHDVVRTKATPDAFLNRKKYNTSHQPSSSSSESEAVFSMALRCANADCQVHLTKLFVLDVGKPADFELKLALVSAKGYLTPSQSMHNPVCDLYIYITVQWIVCG